MNYKIAQFIITPNQRDEFAHEIYIAQPDANKEALAGKLFALVEIKSKKSDSLKIINFLINALNNSYYQNEKMILRERISSIKIEHIFESALAKTNKRLAEFLQSEKIKLNSGLANITIGIIHNDSLHFSNLGKNKALLIYKYKTENSAKYKISDISEQTDKGEAKKPLSMAKLFSNVVSGSIPRGGYFIFSNETFSEYLSSKQIIDITTSLPPASAAEQIKNTLRGINSYVPFLGVIIKNTTGVEMREIRVKKQISSTEDSIENLITTEDRTEKLLAPSGLISSKKFPRFFKNLPKYLIFGVNKKISGKIFPLKDKIFSGKKISPFSLKKSFNSLKNFLAFVIGIFIYIFKTLSDKRKLSELCDKSVLNGKNLTTKAKTVSSEIFLRYKNLSKTNKILLSAFLICAIIFSSNLAWQNIKNKKAQKQAAISGLISSIEQKQNQIDANLLYNNEEGAKKLLEEVKKMISELPQKSQPEKDRYAALSAKNNVQIEKISRVIRAEVFETADFAKLNANANPSNIIMSQEKIFSADASQKTIYIVDLKNKLSTSVNLSKQNISRLDFPDIGKNNEISYFNSGNIVIFDSKTEKLSFLEIDYKFEPEKIIDLKQYNGRYYIAYSASGQIYRFSGNGSKLTNANGWLNSEENLTEIKSMAINGDIYLLKNNGEIFKYGKGEKQNFSISKIEPNLNQASKMIVSENQNIHVLDPSEKRLIVFDKNGNLINQYANDKFDNLKDFQVDEKNKKIYFLNGSSVYMINAE